MGSFQDDFYLESTSLLRRTVRNLKLASYIVRMVWVWAVPGRKIRRAVRRARARGDIFYIDELS